MDSDSSTPHTARPVNAPTRLPENGGLPRVRPSMLADAYALARERTGNARASAAGYRLFWVRGGDIAWMDLPVRRDYAVLGRHTQCDAVLDDPEISLRHLLATIVELADGPALRLIDLHTDVPFYLQDDVPRRSIVASGPVAVRLGR